MSGLSIFGVAVALAMDSFAVSLAGGVSLENLCWGVLARTSIAMGVFQAFFFSVGFFLASFVNCWVQDWDHWITFAILAFVGVHMMLEHWRETDDTVLNLKMKRVVLALAVATSIDALAVGIGFSILDFDYWHMIITIALVSFVLSGLGVVLGCRVARMKGFPAHLIGGIVLVGIGVKILLEHLMRQI